MHGVQMHQMHTSLYKNCPSSYAPKILKYQNTKSKYLLYRYTQIIEILTQVPHCADAPKILKLLIVQMHQIAQLTSGYSGSDLAALARDAAYGPIRFSSSIVMFCSCFCLFIFV